MCWLNLSIDTRAFKSLCSAVLSMLALCSQGAKPKMLLNSKFTLAFEKGKMQRIVSLCLFIVEQNLPRYRQQNFASSHDQICVTCPPIPSKEKRDGPVWLRPLVIYLLGWAEGPSLRCCFSDNVKSYKLKISLRVAPGRGKWYLLHHC